MTDKKGLQIERFFSKDGDPYVTTKWARHDVSITDDTGKPLYVQTGIEYPEQWKELARKVVASKYFYGETGTAERESSIRQLIGRVTDSISRWGLKDGYFKTEEDARAFEHELAWLNLNQRMAFNSPVWFNVGADRYMDQTKRKQEQRGSFVYDPVTKSVIPLPIGAEYKNPQTSACFIQSVDDTLEDIMRLAHNEAMLFKYGSGTGTDLSTLRSSREKLSGGGIPSGPMAYENFYDRVAGIVKSGGKTRRAAKMNSLRTDHPDIAEFIDAKGKEQKKLEVLMDHGGLTYSEAESTVAFQNVNLSVRASDAFMRSVEENKEWQTIPVHNKEMSAEMPRYKARDLFRKIAQGAHDCGDPGIQFHDTINRWHTCPNSGPINASNPCVTGDTRILTKDGRWKRIDSIINKKQKIITNLNKIQHVSIKGSFKTGIKKVYQLITKNGYKLKLTADHKVWTINRGFVPANLLTTKDFILLPENIVGKMIDLSEKDKTFYQMVGIYLGDGCSSAANNYNSIILTMNKDEELNILQKFIDSSRLHYKKQNGRDSLCKVCIRNTSAAINIYNKILMKRFKDIVDLKNYSHQKCFSNEIFNLSLSEQRYVLQGLFTADGTVANYSDKSQYIGLDSCSLQLLEDVQLMLLGFGIKSKLYLDRRAGQTTSLLPDGKGGMKKYPVREMYSLRISRDSRIKFQKYIGFMPESLKSKRLEKINNEVSVYKDSFTDSIKSIELIGEEDVFDLTEPITNTFIANGITVHNCSEFLFVDNSSCNLASLDLLKFVSDDGVFDIRGFKEAVRYTAIAQDLLYDNSSFPTRRIAENSHRFRPLGQGYANLGAFLMRFGVPYDSEEGRDMAAAITSLQTATVYETSVEMAKDVGPFEEFEKNKEPMLKVIDMHLEASKSLAKKVQRGDSEKPSRFNLEAVVGEANVIWERNRQQGEQYGFRNAQATVLAPTGTIAFMMGCDTTGIEPEAWLYKEKNLAGGGILKITNNTIVLALKQLGYTSEQIVKIEEYLKEQRTIEGAPDLREEDLPVFDCTYRAPNGKRTIHYSGHLKMMAAVQPFLSGAISKTVGLPNDVSVEDIEKVYMDAWKMGIKAVALYRDGSKRMQPISAGKNTLEAKVEASIKPVRRKLPITAPSIRHKFNVAGHEGYLHIGLYEDNAPGELFIDMSKEGSTVGGLMDAIGILTSIALQYGAPRDQLVKKLKGQKFEPRGLVFEGDPRIRTADSLVDYIFSFIGEQFPNGHTEVKKDPVQAQEEGLTVEKSCTDEELGGFCIECGKQMKKKGHCTEKCDCGWVNPRGCGE